VSAISINRLPESYPFMETVRTETLQAQGWEKWLPGSNPLGGADSLKSTPIGINSYPALALLSPGSVYADILTSLSQFQAQGQKNTNLPIHLVGNQTFGLVEFFGIVAIAGLGVEVEDAKQMTWFVGF
jgi:hypothetical protein